MKNFVRKETTLTTEAALKMMSHVFEHAGDNGWKVAIVILDASAQTLMCGRMDGVSHTILSIAEDKAFTAALGKSTQQFYERMSSMPDLKLGLQNREKLCAWPGGIPIYFKDELVGAIGVSGAAGDEDSECALSALSALGFSSCV
jgi:glc operon protein GlcG